MSSSEACGSGSSYNGSLVELIAHRTGAAYLRRQGLKTHDPHSADGGDISHTTHGAHVEARPAEGDLLSGEEISEEVSEEQNVKTSDLESGHDHGHSHAPLDRDAMAQILGTVILEFGVIFHSFIIGLTLAVVDDFATLFVVLVFHREPHPQTSFSILTLTSVFTSEMFEGLGLGSRLSTLPLPSRLNWVPFFGAILYACITPLGVAVGLGVRTTYNPDSATALIVSGLLDSLSAGILMYTGLVELLAHDFIFNRAMAVEASNTKVACSVGCVLLGAGIMALLGRWA
ncbi:solute carrier family 39 (zinc transporter), member 1/2/3, partial [Phenoliferia sp. Uapishka_3]